MNKIKILFYINVTVVVFEKNICIHHACKCVENSAQKIRMATTHILNLRLHIKVFVEVF